MKTDRLKLGIDKATLHEDDVSWLILAGVEEIAMKATGDARNPDGSVTVSAHFVVHPHEDMSHDQAKGVARMRRYCVQILCLEDESRLQSICYKRNC